MVPARSVSCYVACGVSGLLFSVVTLACSPLLAHNRVLAPNGGEVFSGGAPHEIVWGIDIPHALLDWDVWYSTTSADGPWTEIAMDLPAGDPSQGSVHRYDWLVPNIAASQAWVRVRMDNDNNLDIDYEDVSDAPFSILPDTVACDFNGSGDCGLEDLNLLLAEGPVAAGVTVTSANGQFDLNGDGRIDNADVDDWLAIAADAAGLAGPYRRGDADLSGFVDGQDFLAWNASKFRPTLRWDHGDFNGDGLNDGADFLAWNDAKFGASPRGVPEPAGMRGLTILALFALFRPIFGCFCCPG